MNEAKAREILGDAIKPTNVISDGYNYKDWPSGADGTNHTDIILDGNFTADELEAIVWWMRNMKLKNGPLSQP